MAKGDRTTRFIPTMPPSRDEAAWNAYNDFVKVFDWMRQPIVPELTLEVLNSEPTKLRNGLVVYADGTNWNPGSGEGVYAYEAGSWVKL